MHDDDKSDSNRFGDEVREGSCGKPIVVGIRIGGRSGGRSVWGLLWGAILVGAGVLLLLDHLGIVSSAEFFRYWPLLLVLAGLAYVGKREGRTWGLILVFAGLFLQLNKLGILRIPIWDLWPLILVAIGLVIMWNVLEGRKHVPPPAGDAISILNEVAVFGAAVRRIGVSNFQGGKLVAVFGGIEIDLRHADIEGREAVLEANAIFGGCEIRVPEAWNVAVRGLGIFGGYVDSTRNPASSAAPVPQKTLYVKGVAMFGGVEVKN